MTPSEPTARRRSRRRLVAQLVLVVLAAAVAWYGLAWVRRTPSAEPLAVIAHRGGPTGSALEGTIGAFEAAIGAGADWLEFDVRRTADDVLVVLHDETVDRTTSGTGRITDLTLAEAQALDAGGGARIPTVETVVDLAKQAGIPILPEIKDGPGHPGLTGQLVDLLRAKGYLDRSVVQAFEPETLEELAPASARCEGLLAHRAVAVRHLVAAGRRGVRLPDGGDGPAEPGHGSPGPRSGSDGVRLVGRHRNRVHQRDPRGVWRRRPHRRRCAAAREQVRYPERKARARLNGRHARCPIGDRTTPPLGVNEGRRPWIAISSRRPNAATGRLTPT